MKNLIIFLLTFLSLSAFAQNENDVLPLPDSLVGRLKEHRKTNVARAEALDEAIMFYAEKQRILEAESYINELTSLSVELKDNYWKALSLYYKSLCEYYHYNYSGFLALINESMQMAEMLRDTQRTRYLIARICLANSYYCYQISQFPECQEYIEKGLRIAEDNGFERAKNRLLHNYGILLVGMHKFEEAIAQFKSLNPSETGLSATLLNISTSFLALESYDSVFFYLDSLICYVNNIEKNEDFINEENLFKAYAVKAQCYIVLKQWDEAFESLNHSKEILVNSEDKNLWVLYYLFLSETYNGSGQYEKALGLNDTAIIVSREVNEARLEWNAVKLKSEILENLNDCDKEVENLLYFNALTDTINKRENLLKVQEQQYQHEAIQIKQQYELQRQVSRHRQLMIIILAAVMVMVAVFVVVLIMLNRKRLAAELELRNREITAKTMDKMQNNEMLNEVIEKLTEKERNPEKNVLPSAIRDLKSMLDADTKKDFDLHFVQVHPNFYENLLADFPNLTVNDLRLCAFIKSNLNTKDIAALNNMSADSVKNARSRLRKKLGLTDPDVSLLGFLSKY